MPGSGSSVVTQHRYVSLGMLVRLVCAFVLGVLAARGPRAQVAATQALAEAVFLGPGASCLERDRLVAHVKMWLGSARMDAEVRVRVPGDAIVSRNVQFELRGGGAALDDRALQAAVQLVGHRIQHLERAAHRFFDVVGHDRRSQQTVFAEGTVMKQKKHAVIARADDEQVARAQCGHLVARSGGGGVFELFYDALA